MKTALLGALLVIAGIAALVIASAHGPHLEVASNSGGGFSGPSNTFDTTLVWDWPRTTYEAVRIGGWALIVFGLIIVAFALVRESRPRTA